MHWFLYDNGLRHERVKNILFERTPPDDDCFDTSSEHLIT